jgi:glucose/mannose transport system substrate-binding protein
MLGTTAASALFGGPALAASPQIEVVHWWTAGGEGQAIRIIRRKLEGDGRIWIDTAVQGPDLAKAAAVTRVLGGNPPTVMLWHVGLDLEDLWRDDVIRDVQSVALAGNWDAVLPEEIAIRLKVGGKYVAVPTDLHCGNVMFGNVRLLQAAGVEAPDTWPAALNACLKLQQSGVIPIAFGGQAWQEASVFVQILTGIGGASLLRRFTATHDPAASDSPEMVESFVTFARLKPFVDKASPNRASTDTANLVATNKAALYFSGDWSRGDLNNAGMRPDVDYVCRQGPGNDGIFCAVVDAFCMPRSTDPDVLAAQDTFARVIMSPEVQHDFNLVKGSIPVRNDVALTGYDACASMAAHLSRGGGQMIPSTSMGMTTAMRLAFYDVVHRFWNTDDADPRAAARNLRIAIERNRV